MRVFLWLPVVFACVLGACTLDRLGQRTLETGGGGDGGTTDVVTTVATTGGSPGVGGAPGGAPMGGAGGDGGVSGQLCTPGEFVTDVDSTGTLQCAPIAPAAFAVINDQCSLYIGWRDTCSGCTDPPAKWGHVGQSGCTDGAGADNTCLTATLGTESVELFGLNTDGLVNFDDQFYLGIECAPVADPVTTGPCPPGSFASALTMSGVECITARGVIASYAINGCATYHGWSDGCDGCMTPPSKWGRADNIACQDGAGSSNTCINPTLDTTEVQLFGVNTDGTVDGNDTFYAGLRCDGATPSGGTSTGACQAGQLVVGLDADGTVRCASPLPFAETAIQSGCFLYYGWRDDCDDCSDPPTKWGRVSHSFCENGTGTDNTCTTPQLGSENVQLFGLNTDGGVDGGDKFYVGLKCAAP